MIKFGRLGLLAATALWAQGAMAQFAGSASASQSSHAALQVPEPSTWPLVLLGLVGAVAVARFIKRK